MQERVPRLQNAKNTQRRRLLRKNLEKKYARPNSTPAKLQTKTAKVGGLAANFRAGFLSFRGPELVRS